MESIKKIYKIGYGPSSSHTMGPGYAAEKFLKRNNMADYFEVELFGSLALTGKGHMTDVTLKKILGYTRTKIIFNKEITYSYHTNAMKFKAYLKNKQIDEWLIFSVGGGDLKEENEKRDGTVEDLYPHSHMNDILEYCDNEKITLLEYIERFEPRDTKEYLYQVLQTMKTAIERGITTTGILPGGLNVVRKAPTFYQKYLISHKANELVYAYALAVSEENASGEIVVTAPTCGSSGIIPAVLFSQKNENNMDDEKLVNALMVGGLIANIVKTNASISGAEVGCQGEIGVACSMAAGMLVYLFGGDAQTIEYGAEIALEHHLGLTCDPVDGLVQIPCIERNAMSALAAYNAAEYAMLAGSKHTVTLDSVIEVMRDTGIDLKEKYKETALGGLALRGKSR